MSTDSPTRYPLQWPQGRPRRKNNERISGKFSTERSGKKADITLAQAVERLQEELDRHIGIAGVVLSSDVPLRLDGFPKSGMPMPADPGVCLYFTLHGKPHALPCDRYDRVEQNIAALAAHLSATRAIERYGVADIAEMYAGFQALPPPTSRSWRDVLGVGRGASFAAVELEYRRQRKVHHPDTPGGDAKAFNEIQRAWEMAQQELKP